MQSLPQPIRYRSFWKLVRLVCFYNIGSLYFGYSYVYFSAVPFSIIQLSISQAILYGCIPFGASIGAVLAQFLLGYLSRKFTFYAFNLFAIVSSVLIYTKNPYCLIIGRILQGMCIGAYPGLTALMVKQLCPVQISTMMGALQVIFINFGLFFGFAFSYLLSKFLQPEFYLNFTFAIPVCLIVIQQILFLTVYANETPKYHLIKGEPQKANKILHLIYYQQYQMQRIIFMFQMQVYNQILQDFQTTRQHQQKKYPHDHWRAVFICVVLAVSHQFSGIGIILLYSPELAASFSMEQPLLLSVLLCSTKVVCAIIFNIFMRKCDQKPLTLIGILIMAIMLLIFYAGITHKSQFSPITPYLLTFSILMHALGFIFAFSAMYSYFAQSLQPNKVTLMVSINELCNTFLSSLFPLFRKISGDPDSSPIFLFLFLCMISIIKLYALHLFHYFIIQQQNKQIIIIKWRNRSHIVFDDMFDVHGTNKRKNITANQIVIQSAKSMLIDDDDDEIQILDVFQYFDCYLEILAVYMLNFGVICQINIMVNKKQYFCQIQIIIKFKLL